MTGEDVEREYTASLYYLGSELRKMHKIEIHFVVSRNDEICRTVSDNIFYNVNALFCHSV